MQDLGRSNPTLGLTLPQQVQCQATLDRPLRPHPVYHLPHLPVPAVALLHPLDVARKSRSSRSTKAFSCPGDGSFFNIVRGRSNGRNRAGKAANLADAVAMLQRRSKRR
jgi:hypothetical protein